MPSKAKAKKNSPKKRTKDGVIKRKKASQSAAEKDLAWKILEKSTLPKGLVTRLLKKHHVDEAVIKKVVTRLVPYMHTPI